MTTTTLLESTETIVDSRTQDTVKGSLAGWGRVPVVPGSEIRSEDLRHLSLEPRLARGLGRAYGDAALPAAGDRHVIGTALADRVLAFDEQTGVLQAEAGLSLDTMCRLFLPRGYFTPVSPGTRYVTLGGMVACDVHGKNHHEAGSFGGHIRSLTVRVADGRVIRCSPSEQADLFRATIGGMGLTGTILEAEVGLVRVATPWIYEEREALPDIDAVIAGLKESASRWPMTVAWLDCLARGRSMGRGVIIRGRWARREEAGWALGRPPRQLPVPVEFPGFALSSPSVRTFNTLYHGIHALRRRSGVVHPFTFFYPLDSLSHWRRLYGRRGFVQYQCVVPEPDVHGPTRKLLTLLAEQRRTSFLCVLKDCGPEGVGLLSFPRPGISVALDIPMREGTQELIDALNAIVIAAGGRIYLAKDALTRAEHLREMEPRLDAFLAARRHWDPDGRFRSAQSVRLFGW